MTDKDIKEIEYLIIENNICRTMKDINKVLEDKLKDDNKLINTYKEKDNKKGDNKKVDNKKVDNKYENNKYYKYNKDNKNTKYNLLYLVLMLKKQKINIFRIINKKNLYFINYKKLNKY
jgi:hypothetical protein